MATSSHAVSGKGTRALPFGTVMGVTKGGVPAFSSDYDTADESKFPSRRDYISFHDGVYCGFKYQCVEFARRWLVHVHRISFPDVGMAYEIFDLPHFFHVADDSSKVEISRHRNGDATEPPRVGSVIMWRAGGFFKHTGHVAIIVEVGEGFVKVAEQNVYDHHWDSADWSRKLVLERVAGGGYFIHDNHRNTAVLGWVHPVLEDYHAKNAHL